MSKRPDWWAEKKISILFQGGAAPNPALKGVPFVLDFAKTEEQRQALTYVYAGQGFGRPFIAPPDLPPERLKMLRDAFDATMKDAEFIADVKKSKLASSRRSGQALAALVATHLPDAEAAGGEDQRDDQVVVPSALSTNGWHYLSYCVP